MMEKLKSLQLTFNFCMKIDLIFELVELNIKDSEIIMSLRKLMKL